MAALLAQSKMSELVSLENAGLSGSSGDFGDDYPGYRWEATVNDFSIEGAEHISKYLRQVDLTVTWGVLSYSLKLYHYAGEGG